MRGTIVWGLAAVLAGSLSAQGHGPTVPGPSDLEVALRADLGTYGYPISTAHPMAQRYFDQGLRALWAAERKLALRSFAESERLDPECAMCAWGLALASAPLAEPRDEPSDLERAREAIRRAERRAGTALPREQVLIRALGARLPPGGPSPSELGYAEALAEAAARYPNDDEIQTLAATAHRLAASAGAGQPNDGRFWPDAEIERRLELVVARRPEHPGACHQLVHLRERHPSEPLLDCAERLAATMPGAGHLVHLPAHLQLRMGRYPDAVAALHRALLVAPGSAEAGHLHQLMAHAATLLGASALALEHARRASRPVAGSGAEGLLHPTETAALAAFGRWSQVLGAPLPAPGQRFATGMVFYQRGRAFAARRRFAEARAAGDSVSALAARLADPELSGALEAAALALEGEIALRQRRPNEAARLLESAVRREAALPDRMPPLLIEPPSRALGRALLAAGRAGEAERIYRDELARYPENGWSLFGLWQALSHAGRPDPDVKARFELVWSLADVRLSRRGW
ncbi:MAG: hypothetical protein AB7R55_07975 [Gemmatimonadales bacterium]